MDFLYFSLLVLSLIVFLRFSSSTYQKLSEGSSLSVENPGDVLISPNSTFSAGFYPVGNNAYAFAIWFSKPSCLVLQHCTVVWMANRDHPVNGQRSKLLLLRTGNLILTDAGQFNVWATDTSSLPSVQLQLNEYGNLVLSNSEGTTLWQSFDSPTDTLLPLQPLTRHTTLVSARRNGNYSTGFQYKFNGNGVYECFPKALLRNGHQPPNFDGDVYIKLPKSYVSLKKEELSKETISLGCRQNYTINLERSYVEGQENGVVKFMLWFACALGGIEIVSIFLVWLLLSKAKQEENVAKEGYLLAATGFKRMTFDELKKATKNFSQEIGRGGVRVVAVKRLNEANQGEAEFLAEVNTIGKLNHMNLIEMWGFCAEKKHKLLVYEYMEHGSLAEKLDSHQLDWEKRYDIALGSAKGLAYLHEECLEWILHCDVKPQNILLDSGYRPKVSDFGLSELLDRSKLSNHSFSKIRGTRGYMAPEWLFNRPITSKVDVYSYGIVMLEMVSGKNPRKGIELMKGGEGEMDLVTWVKEKKKGADSKETCVEEIIDRTLEGNCDKKKMKILVAVSLDCVQEDRDARPTMTQVVERLLRPTH
ncbi:hypothetical protein GOBAR_AA16721 [Gossypium barbadense]|uniref:Non-specific serine/threonine protein kinase n=1 Tax=Gossypium barbadense TaxID=3634 RepID=A0A2P5XKW3_GOSBA|nr:hypothetical protein GOBAR_AA16721 [Gossypium barbadense]